VPANDKSQVIENSDQAENANGVTFLRMENGFAVIDILSGSYSFSSRLV
jgi:hypothetical protein